MSNSDQDSLSDESLPGEKLPIDETSTLPKFLINSEIILTIDQSTYTDPDPEKSNLECFSPTIIRPTAPSRMPKNTVRPRSNSSSLSPSCMSPNLRSREFKDISLERTES